MDCSLISDLKFCIVKGNATFGYLFMVFIKTSLPKITQMINRRLKGKRPLTKPFNYSLVDIFWDRTD